MGERLTFTEEGHEYRYNGKVAPSVTQVLRPLTTLWADGTVLQKARDEGIAVHKLVELECKGELDRETLPAWMEPIYAEWLKFVIMTGFEMTHSEHKAHSETYGFAGTLDLAGVLTKIKGKPNAVIDIKRTLGGKTVPLQLAAYEHLLTESTPLTGRFRRFGLCLDPIKFVEYTEARDWTDFLCTLSFFKLQQRMGKK